MSTLPPELARKIRENTEVFGPCEVTLYANCIVEVLTEIGTGRQSVGWYPTTETEELKE